MALPNGGHTYTAIARDRVGNVTTVSRGVNVNNVPTNPPNSPSFVCSGSNAYPDQYGTTPFGPFFLYGVWVNKGKTLQYRFHINYTADQKPPQMEAAFSTDGVNDAVRGPLWWTGAAGGDYDLYSGWYNVSDVIGPTAQLCVRYRHSNEPGGNPQWTDVHESHIEYQWV
jgi:hypothetical protein